MSLLTVCEALAKNVGLQVPTSITGNQERQWIEARQFANEAGDELARRVDWGILSATTTLTGLGTTAPFALPSNFARLNTGGGVFQTVLRPIRSVSRDEFNTLSGAGGATTGSPRFFVLEQNQIAFVPFLPLGEVINIRYQSSLWVAGGSYTADDEVAVIPEELIIKGLVVRWRRQKGMPYADEEGEYEAALAQIAQFQNAGRF